MEFLPLLVQKTWTYESLRDPKDMMASSLLMLRQAAKVFHTDELIDAQNHVFSVYTKNDLVKCLVSKKTKISKD